jgi:hypothetical protein
MLTGNAATESAESGCLLYQYTAVHISTQLCTSIHSCKHQYTAVNINTQLCTAIHSCAHQYTAVHSNTQL